MTGLRAHHLPLSTRRPPPGRGRVLLAGDALSLINPFTGEGIFYAVLSGAAGRRGGGRRGADRRAAGQRYAAALRRRLGRHLRHRGAAAWLGRRRVDGRRRDRRGPAGTAGSSTRLVDLGLGDGLLDARTLSRDRARSGGTVTVRPAGRTVWPTWRSLGF